MRKNTFGAVYQTRGESIARERIIITAAVLLHHRQPLGTFLAAVAAYPGAPKGPAPDLEISEQKVVQGRSHRGGSRCPSPMLGPDNRRKIRLISLDARIPGGDRMTVSLTLPRHEGGICCASTSVAFKAVMKHRPGAGGLGRGALLCRGRGWRSRTGDEAVTFCRVPAFRIVVDIWYILQRHQPYADLGVDYFDRRDQDQAATPGPETRVWARHPR